MPAYKVTYYDYSNNNNYKSLDVSTLFQGEDFVIRHYAEPGYFDKYLPMVKKMIESFRITESNNDFLTAKQGEQQLHSNQSLSNSTVVSSGKGQQRAATTDDI